MAKIVFEWKKPLLEIGMKKTGGRKGLLYLASAAARFMAPYVPADNLVLQQRVNITAEKDRGQIHYLSPYAHYQWEGVLYVDPKTEKGAFTNGEGLFWSRPGVAKKPTDQKLEYSTFRHPLATSHWEEAMMAARKADLVKEFDDFLKGQCMTKHDAVKQYFEPKIQELTKDTLHFNYSPESADSFGLLTNYADKEVKRFISGKVRKAYGFTVEVVKEYSTFADDLNLECMNFVQGFMDWLDEQNEKKNYPDFGKSCEVEKIEVLQNMPNFAGINPETGLARYMVQGRILYLDKSKSI